jgi:ABC-type polysaccharide/polyol phosphate transport system ATPase subunit
VTNGSKTKRINRQKVSTKEDEGGLEMTNVGIDGTAFEDVPESLKQQVNDNSCVHIQNLRKEFNTNSGLKVAVENLNLTMYSGQITALLGHNGAGSDSICINIICMLLMIVFE